MQLVLMLLVSLTVAKFILGKLGPSFTGEGANSFKHLGMEGNSTQVQEGRSVRDLREELRREGRRLWGGIREAWRRPFYSKSSSEIFLDPWEVSAKPIDRVPLGFELRTETMQRVLIDEIYHWHDAIRAQPCNETLECPRFSKCSDPASYAVGICRNSDLIDKKFVGKLPLNFPPMKKLDRTLVATMADFRGKVYILENVFVNVKGHVFNKTHFFILGGCASYTENYVYSAKTNLTRFSVLANLVTWSGQNFFHALTETLPDLLLLDPILKKFPHIPIATKKYQVKKGVGVAPIATHLGFNISALNLQYLQDHISDKKVKHENLFFAKRVLVPGHQFCGKPSGAVVHLLREKLHVPSLKTGNDSRNETTSNRLVSAALAMSDWLVVVGRRASGHPRAIVKQDELQRYMERLYGRDRVVSFWGNLTVPATLTLFRRTLLFVSPHGAGMTNLLFMQKGAAVLEVMPRNWSNPCYHFLSDRCGLDYYLLYGEGNFTSPLEANFTEIGELATKIFPWASVALRTGLKVGAW